MTGLTVLLFLPQRDSSPKTEISPISDAIFIDIHVIILHPVEAYDSHIFTKKQHTMQ